MYALIIAFLLALPSCSHFIGDGNEVVQDANGQFRKYMTFGANITCLARYDWCANITFYTANFTSHVPHNIYIRDVPFHEDAFCVNTQTGSIKFPDVYVTSRKSLGFYVSYQLSHTCTFDGSPDCTNFEYPAYCHMDYDYFDMFNYKIGNVTGNGECEDLMPEHDTHWPLHNE